jgi:hypothetical protein
VIRAVLIALMVAFYALPWVVNPGASLTASAYDLAEWTSLHPAVRGAPLPLLTPFALRLPLALIAPLIAFGDGRRRLRLLGVVVIVLALLPPPEFLTQTSDANFRQQLALALLAGIGGVIGVSRALRRWHDALNVTIAAIGVIATVAGAVHALSLMRGFGLPTAIGAGAVGLAGLFIAATLIRANDWRRHTIRENETR